jgi:hypothetical protein
MAFATRRDGKMCDLTKECRDYHGTKDCDDFDNISEGKPICFNPHITQTEPVADVLCNVGLDAPAVDEEMLTRAMNKAVEVGLIPKWADEELYLKNWDGMKNVLQAAVGN